MPSEEQIAEKIERRESRAKVRSERRMVRFMDIAAGCEPSHDKANIRHCLY